MLLRHIRGHMSSHLLRYLSYCLPVHGPLVGQPVVIPEELRTIIGRCLVGMSHDRDVHDRDLHH